MFKKLRLIMEHPLFRLLPYVRTYWIIYTALAVLLIIDIIITLLFAWFLMQITDAAVEGQFEQVRWMFAVGLGLVITNIVVSYFDEYLRSAAYYKVCRDLKVKVYGHITQVPMRTYSNYHSGDLVSRLTNDVNNIGGALGSQLIDIVRYPLAAIVVFTYMLSLNWILAVSCLALGPVALICGFILGKWIRENARHLQKKLGSINGFLSDSFAGNIIVRSFKLEKAFVQKYKNDSDSLLHLELKDAKLQGVIQAGSAAMGTTSFLLSLGLGAFFVVSGSLTMGALLAFISLIQYLTTPFTGLANQWGELQRALSAVERLWNILDEPVNTATQKSRFPLPTLVQGIQIERLSFSYNRDESTLQEISLMAPAGKKMAFVGISGAGKSTLFHLLMGLYKPDSGTIFFDGKPTSTMDGSELAAHMTYVPQETYIFTGSIRENIRYGRLDANDNEIETAAKAANAHDFISMLPEGYDTEVGERGARLSGGQRQRIAIARALIKNAPVLLLDEATSSLDSESEQLVKEALDRLMEGRTTFIIAHRLSTVHDADWIVVMDDGCITEQGTHHDLLYSSGLYSRLYQLQMSKIS